jgi:hypothetical protein
MQLLASRSIPLIDAFTMQSRDAFEYLLRDQDDFFLYLGAGEDGCPHERVRLLDLHLALTWLNATPDQYGEFWQS